MKMMKGLYAAAVLASALVTMPAMAATPIISGGKLAGATGVLIGGNSYDVAFLDGSCAGLFGGCTSSNFTFNTVSGALSAGNALLSQVFTNTAGYPFDTRPNLTAGCSNSSVCNILIPFAQGLGFALVGDTVNDSTKSADFTFVSAINANTSTASLGSYVYAKFSPTVTAAVPEPETWAMLLVGFGMMGATLRYRQRSTKLAYAAA